MKETASMTAPLVSPAYIASLIASGKIKVAPVGMGRPCKKVRTERLDRERERQRLKRVAFIGQGLTCFGKKRKRGVYGSRACLTPEQLAEVKRMDAFKHMLKALGPVKMQSKVEWHIRVADRLTRILAGEYDADKSGLTYRQTERKRGANRKIGSVERKALHLVDIERSKLKFYGRHRMKDRIKWHLALADRIRQLIENKEV